MRRARSIVICCGPRIFDATLVPELNVPFYYIHGTRSLALNPRAEPATPMHSQEHFPPCARLSLLARIPSRVHGRRESHVLQHLYSICKRASMPRSRSKNLQIQVRPDHSRFPRTRGKPSKFSTRGFLIARILPMRNGRGATRRLPARPALHPEPLLLVRGAGDRRPSAALSQLSLSVSLSLYIYIYIFS